MTVTLQTSAKSKPFVNYAKPISLEFTNQWGNRALKVIHEEKELEVSWIKPGKDKKPVWFAILPKTKTKKK